MGLCSASLERSKPILPRDGTEGQTRTGAQPDPVWPPEVTQPSLRGQCPELLVGEEGEPSLLPLCLPVSPGVQLNLAHQVALE